VNSSTRTADSRRCLDCGQPSETDLCLNCEQEAFAVLLPDTPDSRTNTPEPAPLSEEPRPAPLPDDSRTNAGDPPPLALEPDILGLFSRDVRLAGLAGEKKLSKLLYLAITSRLLPWETATNRPVSVLVRGTSSTGKSHSASTVQRFFPPEAVIDLGSMSKRYLFYDKRSYSHRVLSVAEAGQVIGDDELLALLRTLLSEGRVIHGTVTADGKPEPRLIQKHGPTALLMCTTRAYVDEELETRMLSVRSDDTPDQTKRVYQMYASLEEQATSTVDFACWHDLQLWLAAGENRVYIPYLRPLAELMPTGATRLRRDFVSLLCLVRAHALLHRATREHRDGRIVATGDDYAVVRGLVGEIIAEGVEAAVSPVVRETVEAAAGLLEDGIAFVTPTQLTEAMRVGRSATYDRIKHALNGGYLANEAKTDERGMKLVLGTDLPGDSDSYLPTVDAVVRAMSGRATGLANPLSYEFFDRSSGSPGRPADPPDEDIDFDSDDIDSDCSDDIDF